MNIRCAFCQTPYTLSRVTMLDALQEMDSKNLDHYDAHCPRCRRATQIPRRRMEMFMPNWREELKQFEAEMKAHPQHEAPMPSSEAVATARQATPVAEAESKPEPKAARKEKSTANPAEKRVSQKPRSTTKKASTAKKTVASSSKRKGSATKSK